MQSFKKTVKIINEQKRKIKKYIEEMQTSLNYIISNTNFSTVDKSLFISDLLAYLNNTTAYDHLIKNLVTTEVFKHMTNFSKGFVSQFYNTADNPENKFITILINGHGADLNNSLDVFDVNTLIFNSSSVPGVASFLYNNYEIETVLNYINAFIQNKPNTFVSITEFLSTTIKNTYVSNISDTFIQNYVFPNSNENYNFKLYEDADRYKNYSCKTIKPIKNREYGFSGILDPGIYVVCGVNLFETEHSNVLLNLLLPNDLKTLNAMFNQPPVLGKDIFNNPTLEKNIYLSDILNYFKGLGVFNVGIIDLTCRTCATTETNTNTINKHRQMVIEELGACSKFPTFGGKKLYKKLRKTRNKKTTRNLRVTY